MPAQATEFTPSFMSGLGMAQAALAYARELHQGQRRESDAAPFILHPLEVAALLYNTGHPEPVLAAAILHDTVEDTEAELEEIRARFGEEVTDLVAAVTEDAAVADAAERKAALRQRVASEGPFATAIYAADKVAKVREMRGRLTTDPELMAREPQQLRLEHYCQSLLMLEEVTPEHPLVRQLRFELEALAALPPHPEGLSPQLRHRLDHLRAANDAGGKGFAPSA